MEMQPIDSVNSVGKGFVITDYGQNVPFTAHSIQTPTVGKRQTTVGSPQRVQPIIGRAPGLTCGKSPHVCMCVIILLLVLK